MVVRTPNGFRWWADRNEQTVEVVGQETGPEVHDAISQWMNPLISVFCDPLTTGCGICTAEASCPKRSQSKIECSKIPCLLSIVLLFRISA